jgi:ATP-binding cassette subfamily C (CFTR/MRP) protein 1
LVTATLVVSLRHQIDPSIAALSISYCITLTGLFQWAIRQSTEAENFMTSAERIHEYGQLVPESHRNDNETDNIIQTANDWPSRGVIQFKDYTCRYRPELDPVLKNLNLRIESKEKIGVIGRTGIITSFMRIYMKNISKQCTVFLFCTCSSNYRKQDGIYPSRVFVKYFTKHRIGSI